MSQTERSLWFSDAKTELKEWSKKSLLLWAACLVASLLFVYLAFAAKANTEQVLAGSVSSAQNNSAALGSAASELAAPDAQQQIDKPQGDTPQELVILDEPAEPEEQGLKRLSETALTLHSSLQSGTESEASYASRAGRVAGLAVAMRQSQLTNSEASFWRPISESVAALEQGVRLGDISNGSASSLISELRSRYVDLRLGAESSIDSSPSGTEASLEVEPVASSVSSESVLPSSDDTFVQTASAASQTLPLSLRLLPWLSVLLPIGCVLFGIRALLNRMQKRHEVYPKKGYSEIAGVKNAQAMTATSIPVNRHAAERKTQAAILQLLDEMEPLSEGDLTHEASVTEDLTGALADAFNHAVFELRRLVKQINRSTVLVRSAVSESRERSLLMARQGAVQAREVSSTSERLEGMQTEIVSLSATSQQVAEYAQKVAKRTQQAAKSVTETRDALATMRSRADVAQRSMQRLVSSTKGIEARLADIKTAAKRTDLLALNSTIHAASLPAGAQEFAFDSTGGFAQGSTETFSELATDVSSLAGQLKSATNDIDQLSDVIRDEAKESLRAVHETVTQVKMCETLSQDAKDHLDAISTAAQALGSAVTEISQRTSVQAQGVTRLADTTQVINKITHDTATALTQAVQDLQNLENMSNSLEASVHGFRLPEEPVT